MASKSKAFPVFPCAGQCELSWQKLQQLFPSRTGSRAVERQELQAELQHQKHWCITWLISKKKERKKEIDGSLKLKKKKCWRLLNTLLDVCHQTHILEKKKRHWVSSDGVFYIWLPNHTKFYLFVYFYLFMYFFLCKRLSNVSGSFFCQGQTEMMSAKQLIYMTVKHIWKHPIIIVITFSHYLCSAQIIRANHLWQGHEVGTKIINKAARINKWINKK